ncbi:unnamed protein product, partial [marine sediment metagenome]
LQSEDLGDKRVQVGAVASKDLARMNWATAAT